MRKKVNLLKRSHLQYFKEACFLKRECNLSGVMQLIVEQDELIRLLNAIDFFV